MAVVNMQAVSPHIGPDPKRERLVARCAMHTRNRQTLAARAPPRRGHVRGMHLCARARDVNRPSYYGGVNSFIRGTLLALREINPATRSG